MFTRRLTSTTLLLAVLLGACQPGATPTPEAEARTAVISEIDNDIQSRPTEAGEYASAAVGQSLQVGGQARSGEESRARLDLMPEATIIRLGPSTEFTLTGLRTDAASPSTRLKLLAGEVWIILNGGTLEVETDLGIASVRGSLMGVLYDPAAMLMKITCLEGICSLSNDAGATDLTDGQASEITAPGEPPSPARPMSPCEYGGWQENSPEAAGILESTGHFQKTDVLAYTAINNCSKTYHWVFSGPQTLEFDTAPGETVSGELPQGAYTLTYWPADGSGSSQENSISAESTAYQITVCSTP
ncbi:MAG: hypothetical protein FD146_1892 [Anaerolineaceae bacterium]|nr:MAG: hypothetical protein FD146_1892 [Anaerolineaceae bacterium]